MSFALQCSNGFVILVMRLAVTASVWICVSMCAGKCVCTGVCACADMISFYVTYLMRFSHLAKILEHSRETPEVSIIRILII